MAEEIYAIFFGRALAILSRLGSRNMSLTKARLGRDAGPAHRHPQDQVRKGNMPLQQAPRIAYLAPEIPALSATFVYEEMLGLEKLGFLVLPVSVHRPGHPANEQERLYSETIYLYDPPILKVALSGLFSLRLNGARALKAALWLISDLARCGVHRFASWKLAYQFLAAARLARLLKTNQCSHLHVHFADVPAQIGMYASAMSGIPFTVMAHANDIFEHGLLLRQKAERAAKMLTISKFNRAFLESVGIPGDSLAIVRCGISLRFSPRERKFQRQDRYRVGTLGRLVEKKGMDVLVRAIADLRNRPYGIDLSIAGDGPLRNELKSLADSLGVGQFVTFEGALPHGDVAAWMQGLDAFVLACKKDRNGDMDGIPVVLMEAMSQSVPVISTRISGIPELIIHGRTGLLADPDDHMDLSFQIDRLLDSPELRGHVVQEAAQYVEKEFGQQVNLNRLTNYLPDARPESLLQT